MINRDDIESGDKCFTRDGGCLVARDGGNSLAIGTQLVHYGWNPNGSYQSYINHPLDIIRIEKAPKPVVRETVIVSDDGKDWSFHLDGNPENFRHAIKLTIINGKLEKSEQVK